MNTSAIKEKLIKEIRQTNDLQLLQAVLRMLSLKTEEEGYQLNEAQLSAIEEARAQYKRGEFLANEEADKEIEEWLKE